MPRKYTSNRTPRRRSLRSWPVRWRGLVTRDVGLDCIFADSAEMASSQFLKDHPMREVISVGAPQQRTLQDRMRHELTWLWSDPVAATVREAIDTLDARDRLLAEAKREFEIARTASRLFEDAANNWQVRAIVSESFLAEALGALEEIQILSLKTANANLVWQCATATLAKLKAALPPAKETST